MRSTTTNGTTQNITYDGNGNMTNSGGRTLLWSADNQPIQANNWPVSEDYAYDADGERVKRSNNNTNVDTFYIGGLFEQDAPSNTTRTMYTFGGQVIAQRTVSGASNTLIYLHSDHLGSVSAATSTTGAMLSRQQYDPWGKVYKQAGTSQTKLSYTGQKLDDTGLLYYHARYYDPSLARFTSPDSIVPGAASGVDGAGGTVGIEQSSKLTVDFHESGFLTGVQGENQLTLQKGFWFQLSEQDKQKAKNPFGPINPQALNRYSYALNNPTRYTDPVGHSIYLTHQEAVEFVTDLRDIAGFLHNMASLANDLDTLSPAIVGIGEILRRASAKVRQLLTGMVAGIISGYGAARASVIGAVVFYATLKFMGWYGDKMDELARDIQDMNGPDGVALMYTTYCPDYMCRDALMILNRKTGEQSEYENGLMEAGWINDGFEAGTAYGDPTWDKYVHFPADTNYGGPCKRCS